MTLKKEKPKTPITTEINATGKSLARTQTAALQGGILAVAVTAIKTTKMMRMGTRAINQAEVDQEAAAHQEVAAAEDIKAKTRRPRVRFAISSLSSRLKNSWR